MTRTSPRLALLAAFAVAVVLAGCGTSSGDAASDSATTTKAEAVTTTAPSDPTTEPSTTDPTDDTGTTVAEEPSGGDDICVPLKVLSDYDLQSAKLIDGGDWTATKAYFVDSTDEVLAAYDDAIALDSEQTENLEALRAVTVTTAEMAGQSSDVLDFSNKLLAQPGIMEAGTAGFALNEFAEENCGFSTGGQTG
jgi:hypothetical protein